MIAELLTRLRFLFARRTPVDLRDDVDDELAFHIEQSTKQNIAVGVSAEEARRLAMVEFGGV